MKNKNKTFIKASDDLITKVKEFEQKNAATTAHSWEEVEIKMLQRRKSLRWKYLYTVSAAACIAIIFSISYFIVNNKEEAELLPLALLENEIYTETKDIILTAQKEQIVIQDDSEITYETNGKISVNDKLLASTPQPTPSKKTKEVEEIHQIYVPKGKRARTTFSDGTVMYINSDTRVIYPARFTGNKREIIVEGEVFLDVEPDETTPFIVKTNTFDVQVLGTRFNVNSYKCESNATVTLVSGAVQVKTSGHANITLTPNQLFEKSGETVHVTEVDVYEYICWIDNIMLLKGIHNAGQVFNNLMRTYGQTIIYDKKVAEIPISGKLDLCDDLEEVLDIICSSLFLTFEKDESNNYIITFK